MSFRIERVANHVHEHQCKNDFYVVDIHNNIVCDYAGNRRIFSLDEANEFVKGPALKSPESPIDIFSMVPRYANAKSVYIVCPGANGKDFYDKIPADAITICVNKGVECVDKPTFWLVADSACVDQEWWGPARKKHSGILALIETLPDRDKIKHTFTFQPGTQLDSHDGGLIKGKLRTGITVGAMAIQFAFWLRPQEIVLVGMDMHGNEYYDGSQNYIYRHRKGEDWTNIIPRMNNMLAWIYQRGVKLRSLSPTALTIPIGPSGQNILHSDVKFSGDVYIVGTGPRGQEHYGKIPHDATVIVVNAAINIMGIPKTYWMCEDSTLPEKQWFVDAVEYHTKQYHAVIPVFIDKPILNGLETPYYFKSDGYIHGKGNPDGRIIPGKTFGAATIACRAFQIACLRGAERIILCGIDMFGAGYFDGTEVDKKFYDERKSSEWHSQKAAFDSIIRWAWDEMGIRTWTLSDTALDVEMVKSLPKDISAAISVEAQPDTDWNLPTVAYMTMCWQPKDTMNILAWCLAQDYPDTLKTIYLIHQEPFPGPLIHDLPFKVVEINVHGEWPALWAKKLWAFANAVEEDIMLVFDEDDCFQPGYTRKAIQPLIESNEYKFAWCYKMRFIERLYDCNGVQSQIAKSETLPPGGIWRPSCQFKRHQSAIGTLAAWVEPFKAACRSLKRRFPKGMVEVEPGKYSGPIDNYMRKLLQNVFGDKLTEHHGTERWYFVHTKASSKWERRKEGYIDGGKT